MSRLLEARDNYKALITVPSNDGNYTAALNYADMDELEQAQKYLIDNPTGNKSRLLAVERELKRKARNLSIMNGSI